MTLLKPIEDVPVAELAALFRDLGEGQNGFGGTPVYSGSMTVEEFVEHSLGQARDEDLPPGRVPQSLWVPMVEGRAAGLFRLRHRLNASLMLHGGHVGYYTRPEFRGRGIARRALAEVLELLREMGVDRALITVDDDNRPSIAVVEACGGVLENKQPLEGEDVLVRRYWIDLDR